MTSMNIKLVYEKLISEFMKNKKFSDKDTILFFQGFPGIFYKTLLELGIIKVC